MEYPMKQEKRRISRFIPRKRYNRTKKKGRVDEMIHKNNESRRVDIS